MAQDFFCKNKVNANNKRKSLFCIMGSKNYSKEYDRVNNLIKCQPVDFTHWINKTRDIKHINCLRHSCNDCPDLKMCVDTINVTKDWLNKYFNNKVPDFMPNILLIGSNFQKIVWSELLKIPYGVTTTYGAISKVVAKILGKRLMSAQAIGAAVGKNPVAIIIPCHRVVGSNGTLTGYAYGLPIKQKLLELEQKRVLL